MLYAVMGVCVCVFRYAARVLCLRHAATLCLCYACLYARVSSFTPQGEASATVGEEEVRSCSIHTPSLLFLLLILFLS